MGFFPMDDGDLLYIARNMRAADRAEIEATRFSSSPNYLVDDCMAAAAMPDSYTAIVGLDKPIAVFGAVKPWPGVYDVWCFGTEDFRKIAFSLTKHIRRVVIPLLVERGFHRAHCRSMSTHTDAHAWLETLGAKRSEWPLKAWGKNREDFVMYEWHIEDILKKMRAA